MKVCLLTKHVLFLNLCDHAVHIRIYLCVSLHTVAMETRISASLYWEPNVTQIGDMVICSVAMSSQDVLSIPHCTILRVFGSTVKVSLPQWK